MILLNFSHPLTPAHLAQVEALTVRPVERVVEVHSQVDPQQPLTPQAAALADQCGLSPAEWQSAPLLVNPPSLNFVAVVLLAELHGRCGYFPAHLRLRPVPGSLPPQYEVAEILDLQAIRDTARRKRWPHLSILHSPFSILHSPFLPERRPKLTSTFFVDKSTGTFADPLLAFGLAAVVHDVLERTGKHGQSALRLSDCGAYYRLDCSPTLDDARLAAMKGPYAPAVAIRTAKNAAGLPSDLPPLALVDYEAERDKRAAFFEVRKNMPKEAQVALARGEEHPALAALRGQEPHPDWDVFRAINPSALAGYNKLMGWWWAVQDGLPDVLALVRDLFAQTPNDLDAAVAAWAELDKAHGWGIKPGATAAQVYNPGQGKGQNRTKADKLQMGNLDAFWLLEWLKAVGFYRVALTKNLSGVKDRKTYVLSPTEIDLEENNRIMGTFKGRMARAETAIRSDVLAALRYTQAMLEFTRQREGASLKARLFKQQRPSRVVSGFYSAFYKDLGNAVAVMNLSFIGLPGWIRVESESDVADDLEVLAEHEAIVRQFDESHSDAHNLLLCYRDFVSGSDLRPFFEFTTAYSGYLIGQRERPGGRARQFTTTNLRRLMMNSPEGPRLSKILETPGFQNIAYAIRQATVTAQYRKQQGDRRYDVRYGLGQQLARKAAYPQDFIAELADFLARYNAENAQVMENRPGPYRRSVQTSDIDDVVALIDEYGDSRLICNLLVAYGYARLPRERGEDEPEEPDMGGTEDTTDDTRQENEE